MNPKSTKPIAILFIIYHKILDNLPFFSLLLGRDEVIKPLFSIFYYLIN